MFHIRNFLLLKVEALLRIRIVNTKKKKKKHYGKKVSSLCSNFKRNQIYYKDNFLAYGTFWCPEESCRDNRTLRLKKYYSCIILDVIGNPNLTTF